MMTTQQRATASLEAMLAEYGLDLVQDLEWGNVGRWSAVPTDDPHVFGGLVVKFVFDKEHATFRLGAESFISNTGPELAGALRRVLAYLIPKEHTA